MNIPVDQQIDFSESKALSSNEFKSGLACSVVSLAPELWEVAGVPEEREPAQLLADARAAVYSSTAEAIAVPINQSYVWMVN